jgi:hypothetical protein
MLKQLLGKIRATLMYNRLKKLPSNGRIIKSLVKGGEPLFIISFDEKNKTLQVCFLRGSRLLDHLINTYSCYNHVDCNYLGGADFTIDRNLLSQFIIEPNPMQLILDIV